MACVTTTKKPETRLIYREQQCNFSIYSGWDSQDKDISTLGEDLLLLMVLSKYPCVAERTEIKGGKYCASTQQGFGRVIGGTGKMAQWLRALVTQL